MRYSIYDIKDQRKLSSPVTRMLPRAGSFITKLSDDRDCITFARIEVQIKIFYGNFQMTNQTRIIGN
jgi:hypothetical protein